MPADASALVAHYRTIERERMQGLPILNPRLEVEAVGFRELDGHRFGILVTPWFMNMVLLPGTEEWSDLDQGDTAKLSLPDGEYEFTVCREQALDGTYLSAVLFRTMADFPDQATARAVAEEVLSRLMTAAEEPEAPQQERRYSRRSLLSGLDAS